MAGSPVYGKQNGVWTQSFAVSNTLWIKGGLTPGVWHAIGFTGVDIMHAYIKVAGVWRVASSAGSTVLGGSGNPLTGNR